MAESGPASIRHNPASVWPVPQEFREIYAHAVETRPGVRLLHISGQVGMKPDGSTPADFAAQCEQAIDNIHAVLAAADMVPGDIVKCTCYLTRPSDLPDLYAIRMKRLPGVCPAATTLIVSALVNPQWLIEIDVVAAAASREAA